ncbi:MAG: MBL fold metallo-hydrolase [Nitrospirae bacterium]|nr:MBL fold metallo-hydrolase [Nitrospirota bacterium]
MITISLQSGSKGNCIYVESCGVKLLFDAGISGIQAERRLAAHGRDIRQVDAVIISHDHSDHICHAGVYQRKYGLPLYVTPKTLKVATEKRGLGRLKDIRYFQSDGLLQFGSVTVQAIPTPHDSVDGAAFVVISNNKRLGILADLGHLFDGLDRVVASLDAVFIESNYDPDMLANGPYPAFLKKRIEGPQGHLSNIEAAELLRESGADCLKWACLVHLSENNNVPDLALRTHRGIVDPNLTLYTASPYMSSEVLSV